MRSMPWCRTTRSRAGPREGRRGRLAGKRLTKIDAKALEGTEAGCIHGFLEGAPGVVHWFPRVRGRVVERRSDRRLAGPRYGQLAQMQPIDSEQLRSDALQRFTSLAMNVDREIVNLK